MVEYNIFEYLTKICKNYKQMLCNDNNVVFYCIEHYIPPNNIELLDDSAVSKIDR